jgi:uncharacterized protein
MKIANPTERFEAEDVRRDVQTPSLLLWFFLLGVFFGVVLIKSEVVSWYRIQEMFRFQSFHMYGVLGSAVATAVLTKALLRRAGVRSLDGAELRPAPKEVGAGVRYGAGGTFFGLGWALTGACPGPILALIGAGLTPFVLVLGGALVGTWSYAALRPKLPH